MIRITEVGPRDGLQNEQHLWSVTDRLSLIRDLHACGLSHIEIGSFVSSRRVPQMQSSDTLLMDVQKFMPDIHAWVLVPNIKGLEQARLSNAKNIAVFVSASEGFSVNNNRASRAEVIAQLRDVVAQAHQYNMKVRAYVSCITYCPFDGLVSIQQLEETILSCVHMNCEEIALGDTTGRATVPQIKEILSMCRHHTSIDKIAMHMHDTYGQGLLNCITAYEYGVSSFDASIAGLGGCPYAPGASGNLATEHLIYCLEGLGEKTGVNLEKILALAKRIKLQKNSGVLDEQHANK
jgi:hydroxymethylglutaryl-CoA lyase